MRYQEPHTDSKDTILNVALKVFGRFGFNKTTMSDIANAAKKGRRTIYTYFKSKEEIFEAVIDREIQKVVQQLNQIVESNDEPIEKITRYFKMRMQFINELANFNEALRKDFLIDYHRVEEIRRNLDQEELIMIEKILREGCEKGIINCMDISLTTKSLLYSNKGFEVGFVRLNYDEQCQIQLAQFLEIIFKGLKK